MTKRLEQGAIAVHVQKILNNNTQAFCKDTLLFCWDPLEAVVQEETDWVSHTPLTTGKTTSTVEAAN